MKNILNSFINWVGGKKALREEIYQIFPKDHKKYAEVFGGGGWVLFGKRQRPGCIEVYNDFNGDLVNLFLCVRDKCLPLLEELGFLPLNSRDEYRRLLKKFLKKESFPNGYLYENLELADRYLPEPSAREIKEILTIQAEQYDVRRAAAYYKSIRYSYSSGGSSYGARPLNIRDFRSVPNFV
ncbi:DNA adenine methylase [Yanshouia hominis]|uniref:DNA adenine methylase n=1 Tax=Yanshouia hominis TaxID=2763673 RepID=UPI00292A5326|nr:DNA adenine methylase [Yanshouia hominis]